MSTESVGPELDHAVAALLGWNYDYQREAWAASGGTVYDMQPAYSTDLGAAGAVLDWLKGHFLRPDLTIHTREGLSPSWHASLMWADGHAHGAGRTPAEAICRLALDVVREAG
jgi:hypothetical protein